MQGEVRTITLDLETNVKAKGNPSQTIWSRLMEYDAKTLLFWRISGTTASRQSRESCEGQFRRRGPDSETESSARCRRSKSSASKKSDRNTECVGSIKASGEHLIGTSLGVVTAKGPDCTHSVDRGLRPRRSMMCQALRGDHQLNIREPGSGHIYQRRGRTRQR